MTRRLEPVPVALPSLAAVRVVTDEPFHGVKDTFLITRFEAGHSEFWAHGKSWTGAPGSIVVFQPGDVHRDVKREGEVRYQLVRFRLPGVDTQAMRSCLAADDPRGAPFQRLHDAVSSRSDAFTLECVLSEAVAAMRSLPEPRHQPTRAVRRALELMRDALGSALSLDALSAHAGLDKFHLCRAFRAQVGLPPHAYLTQLRIVQAKALLAAGTRPKDVAPQVGLYDQSQLNRHFRRIVGMTPGAYFAKNRQSA
jgi:AraC-like DNA-binding protein